MKNTLITITGPSCAGKSTLEAMLVEKGLHRLLSTTTRPMRSEEENNREYRFISQKIFDRHLAEGNFLESVTFNSENYGVLLEDALSAMQTGNAVVVVEPEGKSQFEQFAFDNEINIVRVFITSSQTDIFQRFLSRFGYDYLFEGEGALDRYVQRLITMQTVEKAWHLNMNDRQYDVIIGNFNEDTAESSLAVILERVENYAGEAIAA